ncbi:MULTISPECIES: hypothetical protein [unclassified Sphingobium]|uniref:hypothetical protein n=1 Tax=unclassified Sphingobium TaxID=2611147 RepID=UPI002225314E|nr:MULTISPECIES: hypothetical protein [unclassified Sphingobium]MCW2412921.1 hypothetical protein [Sphingobium sp. B8D3D]MCW2414781.1 hypothetical protein [Sphingobium sp. B8D3A]
MSSNNIINPQLVASIINIIDVATQRGAFRANELSPIGAVVDALSAFNNALADEPETAGDTDAE